MPQMLLLSIEADRYQLLLQFLKTLDYVKVVQAPPTAVPTRPSRYDFSDLAGKLEWKGNAIIEQRRLRDEW